MHASTRSKLSVLSTLSLVVVVGCSSAQTSELPEPDAAPTSQPTAPDGGAPTSEPADAGAGPIDRGPAYAAGTAGCPASDGTRRIKLVNNCAEPRWFKLDGRTTPTWARPTSCPWAGETCTDIDGTGQCGTKARDKSGGVDPGTVYCKATGGGGGTCACNPHFELAPGTSVEIPLPNDAAFPSGTGWIATGCNALGAGCSLGDSPARSSTFEWTYDKPGAGSLYYDISAVNAWTTASAVGMKTCGGKTNPADRFRCGGAGCRFDVGIQCPDGSAAFASGSFPNGASAKEVPTGTVFNPNNVGGPQWTWTGSPDFASQFGFDEGAHAARRYACTSKGCNPAADEANTCLGGCDLCTTMRGVSPEHPDCIKYCCPDVTRKYDGATYRYDSAGCTALGVQGGTDYTAALKTECPFVYTYGYEDHSSTFICESSASLLVQACPDPVDFPSTLP